MKYKSVPTQRLGGSTKSPRLAALILLISSRVLDQVGGQGAIWKLTRGGGEGFLLLSDRYQLVLRVFWRVWGNLVVVLFRFAYLPFFFIKKTKTLDVFFNFHRFPSTTHPFFQTPLPSNPVSGFLPMKLNMCGFLDIHDVRSVSLAPHSG